MTIKRILRPFLAVVLLTSASAEPAVLNYDLVQGWPIYPNGIRSGDGSGIAVNHSGEVLALHRADRPWASNTLSIKPINVPVLMVFDQKTGLLKRQWGSDLFAMPHGISVDQKDHIWITDIALNQVFEFSKDGKLLLTLGERGVAGNDQNHFNRPTDVLPMADGSFYVSDGYINSRIVKFSAKGKYLFQWGTAGDFPGQFNLPHSMALGDGNLIFVCDRGNSRIQVFDLRGVFKRQFTLPDIGRPFAIATLLEKRFAVAGNGKQDDGSATAGIDIIDAEGHIISHFGSFGRAPGHFDGAHDIAAGSSSEIYVADVKGPHFQKFDLRRP